MKNDLQREPSPTRDSLTRDTRGAVYVEFLLAFIPLFFMFLAMLQMGLLYGASLVVQHSSNVAVRAAMVVMDDDPDQYDGATRRSLDTSAGGVSGFSQSAGSLIGSIFGSSTGTASWTGGARLNAIEFAAGMPLLPLSPSLMSLGRTGRTETVRTALGAGTGDGPEARVAWGIAYNRMALAVTFPQTPNDVSAHRSSFPAPTDAGDGGPITARVTYLYNCQIPLANRLMCDDLFFIRFGIDPGTVSALATAFANGTITLQQLQDALAANESRNQRRGRWQPRLDELGNRVNVLAAISGVSTVLGGPSPRFVPILAQATMPMQSAGYCYDGDDTGTGCSWEQ